MSPVALYVLVLAHRIAACYLYPTRTGHATAACGMRRGPQTYAAPAACLVRIRILPACGAAHSFFACSR